MYEYWWNGMYVCMNLCLEGKPIGIVRTVRKDIYVLC